MTQNATSSAVDPTPGNPNIPWPTERPSEPSEPGWRPSARPSQDQTSATPATLDPSNLPDGKKSLSGIAIRAHLLGIALGISACATLFSAVTLQTPLWRVPCFLASLALFHFLEFYTTARYNTHVASISAFLLSANGWAYNIAHGSAIVECIVSHAFHPDGYSRFSAPVTGIKPLLVIGFVLMAVGQVVRSLAMAQAGSNFNHTVQAERKEGHSLVQHGVYSVLRHPSYFGFFWWGLGTQLVLGNVVCFAGYALVLWRFFYKRIHRKLLLCSSCGFGLVLMCGWFRGRGVSGLFLR